MTPKEKARLLELVESFRERVEDDESVDIAWTYEECADDLEDLVNELSKEQT